MSRWIYRIPTTSKDDLRNPGRYGAPVDSARDMTPVADVTVFLLPRRRADGHRAELTSRLRRVGVQVSPVLTPATTVVLVGMGSGAVPVEDIARSVSTTAAAHVGVGGGVPTERDVLDAALAGLQ